MSYLRWGKDCPWYIWADYQGGLTIWIGDGDRGRYNKAQIVMLRDALNIALDDWDSDQGGPFDVEELRR